MTSMEAAASLFGSSDSSSDFFATPEGGNSTSESPAGTKKDDDIFTDGNAGELFADAGKDSISSEAMGMPMLESTNAQQCSETLKNIEPLSDANVQPWITYWRKVKFIS